MSDSRQLSNIGRPGKRPGARRVRHPDDGGSTMGLLLTGGAMVVALGVLAFMIVTFFAPIVAEAPSGDEPIALVAPSGVTVVEREPEVASVPQAPTAAPVAEGITNPSGFAIELGSALSFAELSARFARISSQNAEAEFDRLEPRVTLKDTQTGLEARLLVGPFGSAEEAGAVCAVLALPAGIACRAVPFEGELIARE